MTSLAFVLVAASAMAANPQAADPQFETAVERIKIFEPLVGEWFWDEFTAPQDYPELEMKRGDKAKRIWSFRMDLANSIVVSEVVLEKPSGERYVVAKGLSGWDPVANKVVGMDFWAGPFGTWYTGRSEWTMKGNTLTATLTGSTNKDKTSCQRSYVLTGRNSLTVTDSKSMANGQPVEDTKPYELKRMK